MKIYEEKSLNNFGFWSGAADRASCLTGNELNAIERELEILYPEGIGETELNDLFWFDFAWICQLIGLTEEEVFERESL